MRAVFADEPRRSDTLDTTLLKVLTGQGDVRARKLYREFEQFRPEFKLFITANELPKVLDEDDAFNRRVFVIQTGPSLPDNERSPNLEENLLTEASGILNWLLTGFQRWQERGRLLPPEQVLETTHEYFAHSVEDVQLFIRACCVQDPNSRIQAQTLYERYQTWCLEQNRQPDYSNITSFGRRLKTLGYDIDRSSAGHLRLGLHLRVPEPAWVQSEIDMMSED